MNKFVNKNIGKMSAYKPPLEGRGANEFLRLDFNERTIPVNEKVVQALEDFVRGNLFVYPEYGDLCKKIADYSGISEDRIMITNGSDQGMDVIFRTFTDKGDKVVVPSPSFAMYFQCAQIEENKVVTPFYDENGNFPLDEVIEEIEGASLVVVCNPNNPTGTLISLENVEKIAAAALEKEAIVYVDEAYFEYSGVTATGLINKYPNLIITRTFSKAFGLPSLRIGYTISCRKNIEEMLKVRGPYDVNTAAVVAAGAALEEVDDMRSYAYEVMNEAKPMVEKFLRKKGVKFWKSGANYILCKFDSSEKVCKKLKENGVLVRPISGKNIDGTLRFCIGTVSQTESFIKILTNIL